MSVAIDVLLTAGAAAAWLGALALIRLRTSFERLHLVTFVNVVPLGLITVAAFVADGISSRSLKCALVFMTALPAGALLTHVTARALHLREGERR